MAEDFKWLLRCDVLTNTEQQISRVAASLTVFCCSFCTRVVPFCLLLSRLWGAQQMNGDGGTLICRSRYWTTMPGGPTRLATPTGRPLKNNKLLGYI